MERAGLRGGVADSFAELLGLEDFEAGEGEARVRLTTGPQHANLGGVVHGGVLSALLDFALGASVVTTLKEGEWCATQSLTTDYLRPAQPGEVLRASGRVDRRGKLTAFPSGEIVGASGDVVARATGVWAVRRG
jgi:uncharacterized protein (TIGR00369 family)